MLDINEYNHKNNSVNFVIPKDTVVTAKSLEVAFAALAQKVAACEFLKPGDKHTITIDISVDECNAVLYTHPCKNCKEPISAGKHNPVETIEIRPSSNYDGKEGQMANMDKKWALAFSGNSLVFNKATSKHIIKTGEDISAGQEVILIKPKY